ncbi:MAG: hypothetical protein ACI4TX_01095 [Christensenellales bacterium]
MDKNFNDIANDFAVKYIGGENLNEFSKRVNEINTNCFLTFDDISKIKVQVLQGLLTDAYQSSNVEDVAKCCVLLCVCDKAFDKYFNSKGEMRKIALCKILAKYVYGKDDYNNQYPFVKISKMQKAMLSAIVPSNEDVANYSKVIQEDKIKGQIKEIYDEKSL